MRTKQSPNSRSTRPSPSKRKGTPYLAYDDAIYVGIDNGVSGSLGAVRMSGELDCFIRMPTFKALDYTKQVRRLTRINRSALRDQLMILQSHSASGSVRVFVERPLVNPRRFRASLSAVRALEAVLSVLEDLDMPVTKFVDSKEWQKSVLPHGITGASAQKKASAQVGTRRFPKVADTIAKQKDADGLLIAEWARQTRQ